ncbi:MAG: CBS domain-containing protein [Caldilineaceae bacterium]
MLLKEIMTHDVEVVDPDASIQEAASKMKSLDIGSLPVCQGKKIQGMITDRDIALRRGRRSRSKQDQSHRCHDR